VKPRPEPFLAALRLLGAAPEECIFVGDNLHADVGGASALGMRTVHVTEWLDGALDADRADAGEGPRPDRVVGRLADLPGVVDSMAAR
jgi:FMN phosphatase YigB (HAD superfamily)